MQLVTDNRSNELWANALGNIHCVSENCMGISMYAEVISNPNDDETFDGSYKFSSAERTELREFLIIETKNLTPRCECGRLTI
jgi:hypothetical protein